MVTSGPPAGVGSTFSITQRSPRKSRTAASRAAAKVASRDSAEAMRRPRVQNGVKPVDERQGHDFGLGAVATSFFVLNARRERCAESPGPRSILAQHRATRIHGQRGFEQPGFERAHKQRPGVLRPLDSRSNSRRARPGGPELQRSKRFRGGHVAIRCGNGGPIEAPFGR